MCLSVSFDSFLFRFVTLIFFHVSHYIEVCARLLGKKGRIIMLNSNGKVKAFLENGDGKLNTRAYDSTISKVQGGERERIASREKEENGVACRLMTDKWTCLGKAVQENNHINESSWRRTDEDIFICIFSNLRVTLTDCASARAYPFADAFEALASSCGCLPF